ncbi:AsnC family transcriptional regulator [Paenactinomyces guangxiensis]|uniref:siroheme decarboxylase n=1 Tax=Paenactinomyces guangxiensis TaxID=1490290 RepID=A0A7W1WUI3_9BACL|nr:AsnC family transcriptional regulator [Paenactinomyces guangxiensis]MBA4496299.1 AsnC family transcriptional regulator [Paenactinomyces guangxiensis]MBH8593352.1 AsnC family transcriptional regulator [Paenactinomyces guangxiensis]
MAAETMDALDKELLNLLQEGIDLVPRPFLALAEKLGTDEETVMERVRKLKKDPIRQISAIFDTRTLGYKSSLVAAKIQEERLDQAAQVINRHPGVTHNYKRNHAYNLWFTIAVPPNSRIGLEKTVEILGELAEVDVIRLMPTLKLFKIGVQLDMTGKEDGTKAKAKPNYNEEDRKNADKVVTEFDIAVIRELQKDLPIESRPFDGWAKNIGVTVDELLDAGKNMIQRKQMRRFSAVLNHRKAGFRYNGMGVWAVPADQTDKIGQEMGSFKAVSHCYLRPTYPDWPYNIFTMVHGRSMEECENILQAIEDETGIKERVTLYSTKEYKKTRVSYFTPEMEEWEEQIIQQLGLDA